MTHISSYGAGIYSDLSIATPATELSSSALAALNNAAAFQALFSTEVNNSGGTRAAGAFVRMTSVRDFPAIGTPANIVNVPVYGSRTAAQVQGQSDTPALELTINYIPDQWAQDIAGLLIGPMVGDGIQRVFRFSLLTAKPTLTTSAQYASTTVGLGSVQNTQFFWVGKMEALLVKPALTDATTATLTLSQQSATFGAYTST
jgi:hypothetical protein